MSRPAGADRHDGPISRRIDIYYGPTPRETGPRVGSLTRVGTLWVPVCFVPIDATHGCGQALPGRGNQVAARDDLIAHHLHHHATGRAA